MILETENADLLEEAVEAFESDWDHDSSTRIQFVLDEFGLGGEESAITELVRVDIERRYTAGYDVDLAIYRAGFPQIWADPRSAAEIAFEDRRSRKLVGLPEDAARYLGMPIFTATPGPVVQEARSNPGALSVRDRRDPETLLPIDPGLLRGLRDIGFEVHQCIGHGSFSEVYLATQGELAGRYVVLKVVAEDLSESQRMASLQHTNIVPVFSVHRVSDRTVICMPYAGDLTLREFLRRHVHAHDRGGRTLVRMLQGHCEDTVVPTESTLQLGNRPGEPSQHLSKPNENSASAASTSPSKSPDDGVSPTTSRGDAGGAIPIPLERLTGLGRNELTLWIFGRLARALAHSHARGILHGDLKPANVLIRNDGEPALLDFNLSRSVDTPLNHRVGGTLPYMAPETYHGLMGCDTPPDPRTDLYGLGVMMYEFVSGRLPFPSPRSAAAIDLEIAAEGRRQPVTWDDHVDVPIGLRRIIEKCLAFDPADRFGSADDLQKDIFRQAKHATLVHANEPLRSRIAKWFRRHPRWTSGGGVAMIALLTLMFVGPLAWRWRRHAVQLSAKMELNDFAAESSALLAGQIVDPQRASDASLERIIRPLAERRLLNPDAVADWVRPAGSDPSHARARYEILFRHLGHAAINEIERLQSPARNSDGLAIETDPSGTASRLPKLVAATETLIAAGPSRPERSRSLTFLRADLAELQGDLDTAGGLRRRAAGLPFSGDQEAYLQAVRDIKDHRFNDASALLASLADKEVIPSSLRWTMLARAHRGAKRYEEAKLCFTQAIERSPRSSRLRYLRGRCFQSLQQYPAAIKDFRRALELEPTLVSARWSHSQCLAAREQYDEAIVSLNEGLRQEPESISLLVMRSVIYRRQGESRLAERDYQDAMSKDSDDFAELLNRAKYRRPEDLDGTLTDLTEAARLRPLSSEVQYRLASVLTRMQRTEDAIDALAKVEELAPDDERATIDRGVLLARLGRDDEARGAMNAALVPPNDARTLYQAACVLALSGNPAEYPRSTTLLANAIHSGYGLESVRRDPDLQSLANVPGYRAIVRTAELAMRSRSLLLSKDTDESASLFDED